MMNMQLFLKVLQCIIRKWRRKRNRGGFVWHFH